MAQTTTHSTEMTREEAAALLRSIADELDSGRDVISIPVGNKDVKLSPPRSVDSTATVTERSRRLRKDVEQFTVEFSWNPTGSTGQDADRTGSEPEPGSGTGPRPDGGTDRGGDR